ncbi:MAG: RND family transporter [Thermoplasmata archaeon]|nr:RND family transporter [Thermoplasmata archaeon]
MNPIYSISKFIVKRPKTVFILFTFFTLLVGSQALNVYMISDLSIYLPSGEPVINLLNRIQEYWPVGSSIIIFVEASDVTDYNVLKEMLEVEDRVNKYKRDNGNVDGVISTSSIASLIRNLNSKQWPYGRGENKLPEDRRLIDKYIAQIGESRWSFITSDKKDAAIIIQLSKNADYDKILQETKNAIKGKTVKMTLTGPLPISKSTEKRSERNMKIIFPVAIALVTLVIFIFHRTFKSVIIAFIPPAYSIIITFGILGIVWPGLTPFSIAIGALLLGLGVDYSIHLMNRYAEEKVESLVTRVEKTLRSTGKAVLLSTVTTMIGFGSLMISSMSPIIAFGFACVIGILFCFISSCILVPVLVILLRFEKLGELPGWKRVARFVADNKLRMIVLATVIAFFSVACFPMIKTDVNYLEMAPQDDPVIQKMYEYSEKFGGGGQFNVVLVEGDITNPDVIKAIKEFQDKLKAEGIKSFSIADVLVSPIFKKLSGTRAGIKFILDKMSDDEKAFVSKDYSKTLILFYVSPTLSMKERESIVDKVDWIAATTPIPGGSISMATGTEAINVAINNMLFDQQTRSMILAIALVAIVVIIIFRSPFYGMVSLIPVIFVLMWEPGLLISLDISLSVVTISIASIMIGTSVDYGIHITQRIREGLEDGLSKKEAMVNAVEKTGLSLAEAAFTTVAGLLAVYVVNVPGTQEFCTMIMFMILLSWFAATMILPAFYLFFKRG